MHSRSDFLVFVVTIGFLISAFIGIFVVYIDNDRPAKTIGGLILFIMLVTSGYACYDSWDEPPCICEASP